jgi:hypothetical protein
MQRDGSSEDRSAPGASGRTPPVIEGQAQEVETAAPADANAAAPAEEATVEPSALDAPAVEPEPTPARRRSGRLWMVAGAALVVIAGGVAWLAAPGRTPGDMRSRIVNSLPAGVQSMLGAGRKSVETPAAPAPAPESAKTAAGDNRPAPAETPAPAPSPSAAPSSDPAASASSAASAPSPAEKPATASGESNAVAAAPPSVQPAAPVSRDEAAESKPAGADKVVAGLAARVDELAARLDAAPTAATAATKDLGAKLDQLSQRLSALETRLAAPKADQRAQESRENGASPAQTAGARVVVAQSLTQSLAAGRPLEQDIAALKALGVGDDGLAAFSPYAKAGAPSIALFVSQWSALRAKIVASEAPAAGGDWTDRLLARAKTLVRIEPTGAQSGASAAAVYSRVEAALKRGDLDAALRESDALPEAAKGVAADWRAAAAQRAKAEAAARAIVSDSIAALARPKS